MKLSRPESTYEFYEHLFEQLWNYVSIHATNSRYRSERDGGAFVTQLLGDSWKRGYVGFIFLELEVTWSNEV